MKTLFSVFFSQILAERRASLYPPPKEGRAVFCQALAHCISAKEDHNGHIAATEYVPP